MEHPAVNKERRDPRTYAQRAEYLKRKVSERRRELRLRAVEYLGGRCLICGYSTCDKALEFHHRDAGRKEFGISQNGKTRSWSRIVSELAKCVLLCTNCHREVHAGLKQPPLVTVVANRVNSGDPKPTRIGVGTATLSQARAEVLSSAREGAETRAKARTPQPLAGEAPESQAIWDMR